MFCCYDQKFITESVISHGAGHIQSSVRKRHQKISWRNHFRSPRRGDESSAEDDADIFEPHDPSPRSTSNRKKDVDCSASVTSIETYGTCSSSDSEGENSWGGSPSKQQVEAVRRKPPRKPGRNEKRSDTDSGSQGSFDKDEMNEVDPANGDDDRIEVVSGMRYAFYHNNYYQSNRLHAGYFTGQIDTRTNLPHGMGTWRSEDGSSLMEGVWYKGRLNNSSNNCTCYESVRGSVAKLASPRRCNSLETILEDATTALENSDIGSVRSVRAVRRCIYT